MKFHRIPDETVRRLPIYLRGLLLLAEQGREHVSSHELADILHIKGPQIRKDLSYFGEFGTPGVGYGTKELSDCLRDILNLNCPHKVALVGYGNLGAAILRYSGFRSYGLKITAIFENNPRKIGRIVQNIRIQDVKEISSLKRKKIELAILAIPAESAREVTERLEQAGILGILNFAPSYCIDARSKVKIITIDIGMDLARLPYYLPIKAEIAG
ncbi:MAG: redox-sensing transcriptional repressor Rex [Sedimentisphaerales bacterium]|nr:redox-sensing transcriptional repressor Rex [Sedimentisphaerales bacterium]